MFDITDLVPLDNVKTPLRLERTNRKFARQQERLVNELREKGIDDERVLKAIGTVPRHLFVEQAFTTCLRGRGTTHRSQTNHLATIHCGFSDHDAESTKE